MYLPQLRLEPVNTYASQDSDRMAFQFEFEATVKATGAPLETAIVETWQFRDGKVASIRAHYFSVPAC
ncbi:MAG: nuclear transport factor 2 family protein [Novosphingobium sp.]|nr:nuclear transport factor 2 family protein [Novosphingobium sp.]